MRQILTARHSKPSHLGLIAKVHPTTLCGPSHTIWPITPLTSSPATCPSLGPLQPCWPPGWSSHKPTSGPGHLLCRECFSSLSSMAHPQEGPPSLICLPYVWTQPPATRTSGVQGQGLLSGLCTPASRCLERARHTVKAHEKTLASKQMTHRGLPQGLTTGPFKECPSPVTTAKREPTKGAEWQPRASDARGGSRTGLKPPAAHHAPPRKRAHRPPAAGAHSP